MDASKLDSSGPQSVTVTDTQTPYLIGVDPGFGGAMAVYDHTTKALVEVVDMPIIDPAGVTHWRNTGSKDRVNFDIPQMLNFFREYQSKTKAAIIEQSQPSPQMGITGCFRYGEGFGILLGILNTLGFPIHRVYPSVWKMVLGLNNKKNASRDLAIRHFGSHAEFFKHKRDHGRAEAALLAQYGERFLNAKEPVVDSEKPKHKRDLEAEKIQNRARRARQKALATANKVEDLF